MDLEKTKKNIDEHAKMLKYMCSEIVELRNIVSEIVEDNATKNKSMTSNDSGVGDDPIDSDDVSPVITVKKEGDNRKCRASDVDDAIKITKVSKPQRADSSDDEGEGASSKASEAVVVPELSSSKASETAVVPVLSWPQGFETSTPASKYKLVSNLYDAQSSDDEQQRASSTVTKIDVMPELALKTPTSVESPVPFSPRYFYQGPSSAMSSSTIPVFNPIDFYLKMSSSSCSLNDSLVPADTSVPRGINDCMQGPDTKRRKIFAWNKDFPEADAYIKAKLQTIGFSKKESTLLKIFCGGVERKLWLNTDDWKLRVKNRINTLVKARYSSSENE